MDQNAWTHVRPILERLLELPEEERPAYLAEACSGDDELLERLERMLSLERSDADFLEPPPAPAPTAPTAPTAIGLSAGLLAGPWRLLEELGSGGMGTVWLAERADSQFEKRAAVKFLRPGLGGPHFERRFAIERRALARLEHANIARLLDAGQVGGGPAYLVMEHVDGARIDLWCDERRAGIAERLELFRKVCSAVAFAHANLVVHRDLKPSNVLVTADGEPKLLDFGIARLLTEDDDPELPDLTGTDLRQLTPGYASPEQVMGGAATTATDVYSLGVVLYELLSGRPPYEIETSNPLDVARVVCSVDPSPPSRVTASRDRSAAEIASARGTEPGSLRRRLAGDLDVIVATALHKDPGRRFGSVAELSEDLRRHMLGLPVLARPDTRAYRARKFVTRNRLLVTAVAAVLLSLGAGLVTSWRLYLDARSARDRADRRAVEVRGLADELLFGVYDEVAGLTGATAARRRLVETGLAYLDGLAAEAFAEASIQASTRAEDRDLLLHVARGYLRLGDVLGSPGGSSAGDAAAALVSYSKGLAILDVLLVRDPEDDALASVLAELHVRIADVQRVLGDVEGALATVERMHAWAERDAARRSSGPPVHEIHASLGDALFMLGRTDEALESYETALAHAGSDEGVDDAVDEDLRRTRVRLLAQIGDMYAARQSLSEAEVLLRECVALSEGVAAAHPLDAPAQQDLAKNLGKLGYVETAAGKYAEALSTYERALSIRSEQVAADPADIVAKSEEAMAVASVGDALRLLGRTDEARERFVAALWAARELFEASPESAKVGRHLARIYLRLASLEVEEHPEDATEHARNGVALLEDFARKDPGNVLVRRDLCYGRGRLAAALWKVGARSESVEEHRRWVALASSLAKGEGLPWEKRHWMTAAAALARVLAKTEDDGEREEARSQLRRAVELARELEAAGHLRSEDPTVRSLEEELAQIAD